MVSNNMFAQHTPPPPSIYSSLGKTAVTSFLGDTTMLTGRNNGTQNEELWASSWVQEHNAPLCE